MAIFNLLWQTPSMLSVLFTQNSFSLATSLTKNFLVCSHFLMGRQESLRRVLLLLNSIHCTVEATVFLEIHRKKLLYILALIYNLPQL